MNRKRIFGFMLALALVVGAIAAGPRIVHACSANEVTTTYYSDAAHTTIVGERTLLCNCAGYDVWGTSTPYHTSSSIPCNL